RRQLKYSVYEMNDLAPKTFKDFLAGRPLKGQTKPGSKDAWTTRAALLKNPTMKPPGKAPNNSLAGAMSAQSNFPAGDGLNQPGDIVFFEAGSTLKTKSGTPIKKWTFV